MKECLETVNLILWYKFSFNPLISALLPKLHSNSKMTLSVPQNSLYEGKEKKNDKTKHQTKDMPLQINHWREPKNAVFLSPNSIVKLNPKL